MNDGAFPNDMPTPVEIDLDLLDDQREAIFKELGPLSDAVLWYRPGPKVWSIGEHLDHTRVINCFTRRLMIVYFPVASIFARLVRQRPYQADIDNVYKRPGFPMNVGWIWPPKYKPRRAVSVGFLHEALREEHAAYRRFYTTRDEQLLGHTVLADPVIGALNLVQWLRVQVYHDAHHYERVRVRFNDPDYARKAEAAGKKGTKST
jgi:DinB superfamily